jgi:quercetin dioxygenase-like cupin family protein
MVIGRTWIVAAVAATAFFSLAQAQDGLSPKNRQELKRSDVSGTNMEIIISVIEYQPGETLPLHIHHGEEAFYVLQGGTSEEAGQTADRSSWHQSPRCSTRRTARR